MPLYFEVTGVQKGKTEVLFGSFLRDDCVDEKEAERDSWKNDGYSAIKITSRETKDKPDKEIYGAAV